MNYKLDEDFDFYSELNKEEEEESIETYEKKCMISHMPLTFNSVTLSCGHTYNYLPLYNELCLNRTNPIKCPYCRIVPSKLMFYIPLPNVKKIYGVNFPPSQCMPSPICNYKLKYGKNKGIECGKNGIENENGILCDKHRNQKNHVTTIIWTHEKENLFKSTSVIELKKMLREKGLKTTGLKKDLVNRLIVN